MSFKIVKYKKNEVELWDKLVTHSKESTLFASSFYISACSQKIDRYFVYKGNQLKAGIYFPVIEKSIILSDLLIYSGILFNDIDNQKNVKKNSEKFLITEFIIEFITQNYSQINICLYNIKDLRPFLWKNYHSNKDKKFLINIQYTSILNIDELFLRKKDYENDLFINMDSVRQSDIKKGIANIKNLEFNYEGKINLFMNSYNKMMKDNGVLIPKTESEKIKKLIVNLISECNGNLFELRDKSDNKILYFCFFAYFKNEAYYLYGSGEKNNMTRYSATYCLWECFKFMSTKGISRVNLEGVNSPMRGQYKMSLGGKLKKYYNIIFS